MQSKEEKTIQDIWKESAIYYQKNFPSDKKKHCLEELGLTKETIKEYQLGWADGGLKKHLGSQKYSSKLSQAAGVLKDDGNDSFKGLIIPYQFRDQVVCLRCRRDVVKKDGQTITRYYSANGSSVRIFNKKVLLKSKEVIVCKNELDCLLLQQLDINAIAIPDYASFKEQWVRLFDHCDTVYILLNADSPEETGAFRIGETLGEKARISFLPDDQSIADLYLDDWDKAKFQKRLGNAKTYIQIKLEKISKVPKAERAVKGEKLLKQISQLSPYHIALYKEPVKKYLGLGTADFNKTIKNLQQEQALMEGNGDGHAHNEDRYEISEGRMCLKKVVKGMVNLVPLCNFTAEIVEEIEKDDGGDEIQRVLSVQGKDCNGNPFETITIDSSQFNNINWVMKKWGTKAKIEMGYGNKDHIPSAIQCLSTNIQTRRVYTHTGWREEEDKHIFITAKGALGSENGIQVELEGSLERYALPVKPTKSEKVKRAIRKSIEFLDIASLTLTIPLWAAMYLAPLNPFFPQDFVLWLYGRTGSKKSTLSALALSHFGKFDCKTLPEVWESTAGALEMKLFLAKDVPIVIDDFAPQTNEAKARDLESRAAEIVRTIGNRAGRSWLDGGHKLGGGRVPRGFVISTGEQLPNGHSVLARMLTININEADVKMKELSQSQKEASFYPRAMAAYILWIADRWEELKKELPEKWQRERQNIKASSARLPEIYASLYVAMDTALSFAQEVGEIPQKEIKKIRQEGEEALRKAVLSHSEQIKEENPIKYFLEALMELIAQKELTLLDESKGSSGSEKEYTGKKLGWIDKEHKYIYLFHLLAYEKVYALARREGGYFPVKKKTLLEMLKQEHILIPRGKEAVFAKSHKSKTHKVIQIRYEVLFPPKKNKK